MDIHDYLYGVNGALSLAGSKSFIRGNLKNGLAHLRMAYDKSGMGRIRHVYQFGNSTYIPGITYT